MYHGVTIMLNFIFKYIYETISFGDTLYNKNVWLN